MKILEIPNFAFRDEGYDYSKFFCKNDQWPLLRLLGAEFVFKRVQYVVEEQSKLSDICVLLFYLHPWEFEEMPEKYDYDEGTFIFRPELHKNSGESTAREFSKYIALSLADGFSIVAMEDFYTIWRERMPWSRGDRG